MLNKMTKQELEVLSYTDLTELIFKEEKKELNTPTLFRKICDLLELSDDEYASQIGDYYTSLTTDKRFVSMENGNWDLRDKHAVKLVIDEEDDEDETDEEMDDSVVETVESEDIDEMEEEEGIEQDDDMDDLTILDEEDMEEDE